MADPKRAERILRIEHRIIGVADNDLFRSLSQFMREQEIGLGEDIRGFINNIKIAQDMIEEDPTVLDQFKSNISGNREQDKFSAEDVENMEGYERILYYRANPWRLLSLTVPKSVFNKTTPVGVRFNGFSILQKRMLRDMLDPTVSKIIITMNRGGAKTFLSACAIYAMQYLIPKVRISIVSGSQEQSDYMYTYFKTILTGSPLVKLVDGEPLRSGTNFHHGGWVKAFPASEKKVRGPRPDVMFIDEACQAESNIISAALGGSLTALNFKLIVASTPNKMVHVFKDWWDNAKKLGFVKYHQSAYDCPWIQKSTIDQFKTILDEATFKIEVLGEFASATGSVFDEKLIREGIIDKLPETVEVYDEKHHKLVEQELVLVNPTVGIDWGYKHPTVVTVVAEDQLGRIYVLEDIELNRPTEAQIEQVVVDMVRKYDAEVYADSSSPFQINHMRLRLLPTGHGIHPVVFSRIKDRLISNVRTFMENHALYYIRDKTETLINQLIDYSYEEDTEKPKKENDDHVDSLMVAMWPHRETLLAMRFKNVTQEVINFAEHLDFDTIGLYNTQ